MAPAAPHESRWSEEVDNNVELELASSSGNGSEAPGGEDDQGWQEVTNPKKQRRREKQQGLGLEASRDPAAAAAPQPFQALERASQEKIARRKARSDAWANGIHHGEGVENGGAPAAAHPLEHAASNGGGEKKKPKKVKKPKVSIAAAAAAIDASDLAAFLATLSSSFDAGTQLIHCVDYFIDAFKNVIAPISWENASKESLYNMIQIPIQDIPENVSKATSNWLAQKPLDAASKFTLWAIHNVLFDASPAPQKGGRAPTPTSDKTKVAVLVVLSLLLRKKPEALLSVAEELRSIKIQGPPTKLYALAWVYGQACQGDLLAGLALWVQNLLPLALGKQSTLMTRHVTLQFFESVILAGDAKKTRSILLSGASRKERLVPPAVLISLLHVAYPPESLKTKATERFRAIYPTVKEVALGGSARSKVLKSVAQQLLPLSLAAAAEDSSGLSLEACNLFRWCLYQAPECYKQWEKLHLENLTGSVRAMRYLSDNWSETQSLLAPVAELKSTVGALRLQHGGGGGGKKKGGAMVEAEQLLKKMSGVGGCIKASATLACLMVGGYGLYLLNPNVNPWQWDGGLLLSKTHPFL